VLGTTIQYIKLHTYICQLASYLLPFCDKTRRFQSRDLLQDEGVNRISCASITIRNTAPISFDSALVKKSNFHLTQHNETPSYDSTKSHTFSLDPPGRDRIWIIEHFSVDWLRQHTVFISGIFISSPCRQQ
jgi:hypothetical protein